MHNVKNKLYYFLKLYVKNMVGKSCITVVKDAFKKMGLPDPEVSLGEINIDANLSSVHLSEIRSALIPAGFELLEDKKAILVQQIKTIIL